MFRQPTKRNKYYQALIKSSSSSSSSDSPWKVPSEHSWADGWLADDVRWPDQSQIDWSRMSCWLSAWNSPVLSSVVSPSLTGKVGRLVQDSGFYWTRIDLPVGRSGHLLHLDWMWLIGWSRDVGFATLNMAWNRMENWICSGTASGTGDSSSSSKVISTRISSVSCMMTASRFREHCRSRSE